MFIVQSKNGISYTEGNNGITWDKVPQDIIITSLSLTLPFKVRFQSSKGFKDINPKFTIKGFKEYYFFNESIARLSLSEGKQFKGTELIAKTIAGIRGADVYEYRMDKHGNINLRRYLRKELKDNIDKGLFDSSVIRKGV